jgi:urea carboxylase
MNPSRVFTPAGQVSWGGSCMALYNVESPGGYQLTGLTIPGVDYLGSKAGYSVERPWLFEDFDQLTFYEVSEEEYEVHSPFLRVSYKCLYISLRFHLSNLRCPF